MRFSATVIVDVSDEKLMEFGNDPMAVRVEFLSFLREAIEHFNPETK